MVNYNPRAPIILGQEWVPIRDEYVRLTPTVNAVEYGYKFTLPTAKQVNQARFYVDDYPSGYDIGPVIGVNVYPAKDVDNMGPLQRVVIPCNSLAITGLSTNVQVIGNTGGGATSSVLNVPGDDAYVDVQMLTSNATSIRLSFAVSQFPQLNGKRITGVNLLYILARVPSNDPDGDTDAALEELRTQFEIRIRSSGTSAGGSQIFTPNFDAVAGLNLPEQLDFVTEPSRLALGDVSNFWLTPLTLRDWKMSPWNYSTLSRFEPTAGADRISIEMNWATASPSIYTGDFKLGYAALEVVYCEETRIAYGGIRMGGIYNDPSNFTVSPWVIGANVVPLRAISDLSSNPILPAGDYVMTVAASSVGDAGRFRGYVAGSIIPPLLALRELYDIPSLEGEQLNLPYPADATRVGALPTQVTSHIIPQLSLHATGTGAVIPDIHPYGRQAVAPVYGTTTATTEIYSNNASATAPYAQVRFYARHLPETIRPLVLTSSSVSGSVSITPEQLDALPEIVDGWREVTLRFLVPTTFVPGNALSFTWSSTNELIGRRWEVLGTWAPAPSGVPGTVNNQVPSAQRLGPATYGTETISMAWQTPLVSGGVIVDDGYTDGVLLLSQDPPSVTGLGVVAQTLGVTQLHTTCGVAASCAPTGVGYHHITWNPVFNRTTIDTFSRTAASGWGTPDTGSAWTVRTGSTSVYSANGSVGVATLPTANVPTIITSGSNILDSTVRFVVSLQSLPATGFSATVGGVHRYIDANNYYRNRITFYNDGHIELVSDKVVAGVGATIVSNITVNFAWAPGDRFNVLSTNVGSQLMIKIWRVGDTEPDEYQYVVTDTSLSAAGLVGFYFLSNTTGTMTFNVDDVTIYSDTLLPAWGAYELQRSDAWDSTWQTIALISSPYATSFEDYEARVGVQSSYRIRTLNVYEFAGSWSSTVLATLPAPGVSPASKTAGTLIFTTNEVQDGSYSLAYVETSDKSVPIEDFVFPEADTVVKQRMYGKFAQTTFHPSERGGVEFTRLLLLNNASVPASRLDEVADSLRNLAWADTSYICVRTEQGDRWFMTVIVPDVSVKRQRQLQIVRVQFIETTDTPSPVDPS